MIVDELVAILGYEMRGQDKLRAFTQSIDNAARRLATFAAAAATAAAGAAALLGKSIIDTTAQFESYAATLETIEGSAEKANKSLDWIAEFAKKTPYDVAQVTEAFIRMRAYGLDPMDGSLTAVGDAASAMGKSLMDGVEAIADATTGENERLKAFGITSSVAGNKITYTWRQNGKEMSKTLKKSGLEIAKFLKENFELRFAGAMIRQSKTWNGMLANLGDTWTDFQRRVGEAGFFDAVKNQLGNLLDFIGRLDADGSLDRWAKNMSSAFTWASEKIGDFALRIGRHIGTIADIINNNKEAWEWLKWALLAIAVRLFPVAALFSAIAFALDEWLTYMRGGETVIGDFIDAIAEFLGADPKQVADVLGKIAGAAAGLVGAAIGVSLFAGAIRTLAGALTLMAGAGVAKGAGLLSLLGGAVRGAGGLLARHPLLAAAGVTYGALNDVPHEAMASATKDDPELLARLGAERQRWQGVHFEGGRHRAGLGAGPSEGGLDEALRNLRDNTARMNGGRNASAVTQDVNDNRNQSVKVDVGGVVVNGVVDASAAVGAKVGAAVGGSAARAGGTRFEKDDQL